MNTTGIAPKSTIKFLFRMWAMGCTDSLAFSKVPDARRQEPFLLIPDGFLLCFVKQGKEHLSHLYFKKVSPF